MHKCDLCSALLHCSFVVENASRILVSNLEEASHIINYFYFTRTLELVFVLISDFKYFVFDQRVCFPLITQIITSNNR